MPAIEIEYPLADAQLGLSFQAGGTYDLTLREKRPKKADGPVYIRCYLYRPDDDTVYQSDDFATASTDMGVWSVSFSLPRCPTASTTPTAGSVPGSSAVGRTPSSRRRWTG